jgi:anti-anti-sigma regulatory factor
MASYLHNSGIQILVAARKGLPTNPASVVVITGQPAVLQALRITGLDRVVRVLGEPEAGSPLSECSNI